LKKPLQSDIYPRANDHLLNQMSKEFNSNYKEQGLTRENILFAADSQKSSKEEDDMFEESSDDAVFEVV
jgi:hypothetical protein